MEYVFYSLSLFHNNTYFYKMSYTDIIKLFFHQFGFIYETLHELTENELCNNTFVSTTEVDAFLFTFRFNI